LNSMSTLVSGGKSVGLVWDVSAIPNTVRWMDVEDGIYPSTYGKMDIGNYTLEIRAN
jgi:hypothetical protein